VEGAIAEHVEEAEPQEQDDPPSSTLSSRRWYQRWWVGLLLVPIPIVAWAGIFIFFKYLPVRRPAKFAIAGGLVVLIVLGGIARWEAIQEEDSTPSRSTELRGDNQRSNNASARSNQSSVGADFGDPDDWDIYRSPVFPLSVGLPPGWTGRPWYGNRNLKHQDTIGFHDGSIDEPGEYYFIWMDWERLPSMYEYETVSGTVGVRSYPAIMYFDEDDDDLRVFYEAAGTIWGLSISAGGDFSDADAEVILSVLNTIDHGL